MAQKRSWLSRRAMLMCSAGAVAAPAVILGRRSMTPRQVALTAAHSNDNFVGEYHDGWRIDPRAHERINWLLRDRHANAESRIDPDLIDLLWRIGRQAGDTVFGSHAVIEIHSAYRTPRTSAALGLEKGDDDRLHALGRAADIRLYGGADHVLRRAGLAVATGGIGPAGRSVALHLDTGPRRRWGEYA